MQRVVFCPNSISLDEAKFVAKELGLPIQVGHTDKTLTTTFDDSKVSIIKIPEYIDIFYYQQVKQGFHQNISYINEFFVLKNNTECFINNLKIKPLYEESHKIKYNFLPTHTGEYFVKIMHNDEIVEFDFVVY